MTVDWDEWKNYFLLHPAKNIDEIAHFWKRSTMIDIGESIAIPDDITEQEKRSGNWWKRLVAGGIAGGVARTCMAPFDRLKVMMQHLKNHWLEHHARGSLDPGIAILLGCSTLSNACGQMASFPLNLIRTRMQAQALEEKGTTSMIQLIQDIYNKEGKRGFFRGVTPNIIKVLPSVCISCVTFEKVKGHVGFTEK